MYLSQNKHFYFIRYDKWIPNCEAVKRTHNKLDTTVWYDRGKKKSLNQTDTAASNKSPWIEHSSESNWIAFDIGRKTMPKNKQNNWQLFAHNNYTN